MKTAWISSSVIKEIKSLCADKFPLETGGLLFGYWGDNGEPVINTMIGPGPVAKHGRFTFEPDYDYHDLEVDKIYADESNRNYYLGDWHCHPHPGHVGLSEIDIQTLNKINIEVKSNPGPGIMMILGGKDWEIVKLWDIHRALTVATFEA